MELTTADKRRIWEALLGCDPYDASSPTRIIDDEVLYFDGYLGLDDFMKAVDILESIKREHVPGAPH